MTKRALLWIAALFLALTVVGYARAAENTCGDQAIVCGDEERCCEHTIAMFSDGGATVPPYTEGRCVPREQKCEDFWCGNRHCESGFFGLPNVCCVTQRPGLPEEYKCAYSEFSCPGNTQQLTIRTRFPDSTN